MSVHGLSRPSPAVSLKHTAGSDDPSPSPTLERLQRIIEAMPSALLLVGADGAVEMLNAHAEQIFGWARAELLGRPIEILLPPRYQSRHQGLRTDFAAQPQTRLMGAGRDLYALRKDGSEFPVEVGLSRIDTDDGPKTLCAVIDLTARKQGEQRLLDAQKRAEASLAALSRSEQRLRQAQRLAQMGSDLRNLASDEAEWSDETYRILGVSRPAFTPTSENFLRLVHPDDRAALLGTRNQVRQGICPPPYEFRIVRPDGSIRHIYRQCELVHDGNGALTHLAGTMHDVTERRQTEAQLRQAQKMEAIGNLTGGMAHDFNNLLGVIIGNLDLAQERVAGAPEVKEMLGDALEAAWRGADLTRRLLAFARRQPLRPVRIQVNELVADTVRLLRRLLGEDIDVSLVLADGLWPVVADPAQLEAALANLATNARDAMPKGGRLIIATANRHLDEDYAAAHAEASAGDFVLIEVSDTGTGMSADVVSRIFEPFFTTKEQGKGSGLGLSMVFGFLRQSGGHVSVYSEPGIGTTFRLYLPRATGYVIAREVGAAAPIDLGAGETVLVVEDNAALRRIAVRQLEGLGYFVLECERAAAALELLQREPVDLLFTDIVMPGGLDGVELARLALERWPTLKVVLTSGFPQARIDAGGELLQGVPLLSKPYSKEELAAALHAALSG